MFSVKKLSQDAHSSLARFTDFSRDSISRAKHLRLILEGFDSISEKQRFVDEFSFEIFHLVDSLLVQFDPADVQILVSTESALWTLEQLLVFLPGRVGKGWQRQGIGYILRRALHPRNVFTVRKIAIRLFVIWYQCLLIHQNNQPYHDIIFKCCVPYFPLRDGKNSERILTALCEKQHGYDQRASTSSDHSTASSGDSLFNVTAADALPLVPSSLEERNSHSQHVSTQTNVNILQDVQSGNKERAQTLQLYLDKFLEYLWRDLNRVEWNDSNKRVECAKFLLERIISFYICEVFPDLENSGVDVFGGWEAAIMSSDELPILDTTNPLVVAKYWLIRWFVNIATEQYPSPKQTPSGLFIYKEALLSSQKAINVLLSLMREAMFLPLACINVVNKVLVLVKQWLFQYEKLPFVEFGNVQWVSWNLFLIRTPILFLSNPHLSSSGERMDLAITSTSTILQLIQDFANPLITILHRSIHPSIWNELLKILVDTVSHLIVQNNQFVAAIAGGLARTILVTTIFIVVFHDVEVDVWDQFSSVFNVTIWPEVIEQWSLVANEITRALLLNINMAVNGSPEYHQEAGSLNITLTNFTGNECSNSFNQNHQSEKGSKVNVNRIVQASIQPTDGIIGSGLHILQPIGSIRSWLKSWMRIISLVSTTGKYSKQAVQTIRRAIETLYTVDGNAPLINWLGLHLNNASSSQDPYIVPTLCELLVKTQPPLLERSYFLHHLINSLCVPELAYIIYDYIPKMNISDSTILSSEVVSTLQKLVKNPGFSSRAVKITSLLALSHPEAEMILCDILEDPALVHIDLDSLVQSVNSLCILVLERSDLQLFEKLSKVVCKHPNLGSLLPLLCSNLVVLRHPRLHMPLFESGLDQVRTPNKLNDLKWQLCSLAIQQPYKNWRSLNLFQRLSASNDKFFEAMIIQLSGQYPLPAFHITQWNSHQSFSDSLRQQNEPKQHGNISDNTFLKSGDAILSFEQNDTYLWSRTVFARHCYSIEPVRGKQVEYSPINEWLSQLSSESMHGSKKQSDSSECLVDIFQELPRPVLRNYASSSFPIKRFDNESELLDISVDEMLKYIQSSSRKPQPLQKQPEVKHTLKLRNNGCTELIERRKFLSDLDLISKAKDAPNNFTRELRHLDMISSREVHKVAVIYVAKDQEDKQTILSNMSASESFDEFIKGLGWTVQIGSSDFFGYAGGLPSGQKAPYYSSPNTELIFHVSTWLNGDNTQRMKHLGNDEVHVVWSENTKPYRRELISTRFCDVLIVLYVVSPVLIRVHIETQNPDIQFGPLFDGACVHIKEIATLVRETVMNASRAYRNLQAECDRPNKHREKVFHQTQSQLTLLSLSASILRLYTPSLNSNL